VNNSFTLSNRLLKARLPVFWLKAPTTVAGVTLAPGALWIPASARAKAIVTQSVGPLGVDAYDASRIGPAPGAPVKNILVTAGIDGKDKPISSSKFYVPGPIVTVKFDVADPLAYGVPETVNMFYNNNPVFSLTTSTNVHQVASYYNDDPLVSEWAWGQKLFNGNAGIVDATVGRGRVYLLGGEVTQRGQPYATFKFLFNGIFAGPSEAHRGS
jgi:hypothetical protein